MARAKKDYKNLSMKMDSNIHSMLVSYANAHGLSLTAVIEHALKEKIERENTSESHP